MVHSINRAEANRLRKLVEEAVKAVSDDEDLGLAVKCSYSHDGVFLKIDMTKTEVAADGSIMSVEAKAFKDLASIWGLSPDDLGKEAIINGKLVRIIGAQPNRRKYPILCQHVHGEKRTLFTEYSIKLGLEKRQSQLNDVNGRLNADRAKQPGRVTSAFEHGGY